MSNTLANSQTAYLEQYGKSETCICDKMVHHLLIYIMEACFSYE